MSGGKLNSLKFYNEFNNGTGHVVNLNDYTPNLVGNVGDRIQVRMQISVWWISEASVSDEFNIVGTGNTLQRVTGNFITDGFVLGDVADFRDLSGFGADVFVDRTITSLTATEVEFDGLPVALGGAFTEAKLIGKNLLTALRYKFGLIGNNESTNFLSKIDPSYENAFTNGALVQAATPMNPASGSRAWIDGSITIAADSQQLQQDNFAQWFSVVHDFIILPYFVDGELSNLQNNIQPTLFASTNSIKYVFQAQFNTSLSNPNGSKDYLLDNSNGSVGYFGESLNGNASDFKIENVSFLNLDTGLTETGINAQQETRVSFRLNSLLSTFTAQTDFIVAISILPPASDYQQNQNTFEENFLFDDVKAKLLQLNAVGTIITAVTSTLDPSFSDITFDVNYLTADEPRLDGMNYVIWVATCDETLSGVNSNRVPLILDAQLFSYNTDVSELMYVDEMLFFPHDVDITDEANSFDNIAGWIEDGFVMKMPFSLNIDERAFLSSLKINLTAYNPSTDHSFDLQSFNYNLANAPQIQQLPLAPYFAYNVIGERAFELVAGSQFNKAELTTIGPGFRDLVNVVDYELICGIKANFEEWIAQPDANTVFYDILEPLNGLNKKSSNYSLKEGYEIIVRAEAECQVASIYDSGFVNLIYSLFSTTYNFLSQPHAYFDYDLDDEVTPLWAVEIKTFDESGINTQGVLQTAEKTRIAATFTPLSGVTNLVNPYAIIRLNPNGGNINTILELSSKRQSKVGNILIPLVGENYTKITDDGLTVVVECLIDNGLLNNQINYDISARLGDDLDDDIGIETELSVLIETEIDDIIIIE